MVIGGAAYADHWIDGDWLDGEIDEGGVHHDAFEIEFGLMSLGEIGKMETEN